MIQFRNNSINICQHGSKLQQKQMIPLQDCYLLDTGGSGLFVWIGRESSKVEKVRSMELATKYLERNGYPKWTRVERVVEGTETTVFKQYFKSWKEDDDVIGFGRVYTQNQIAGEICILVRVSVDVEPYFMRKFRMK